MEELCREYGIEDMLQDNGLKVMQQLVYLDMDFLPGREGNNSVSRSGTEREIYVMTPDQLEPVYRHWEDQLANGRSHLNNPKIPVRFVRENGLRVYPINPRCPIDPNSINY